LTLLAYLRVCQAGFIWDDNAFLTENPLIKAADGLRRFWITTEPTDYFPLTSTTLWLEWRMWGQHALGYHVVNVLLHALSAVLWWRVLARLGIPGAWLAAAMFAVHPVNVESVAWITERKNTLTMVFFVASIWCFLRDEAARKEAPREEGRGKIPEGIGPQTSTLSHRAAWYWLSFLAFACSLLSKTAAAPMPLVLLGLAWWQRGRVTKSDAWRTLPFFMLAGLLAVVTVWFQYHRAIGFEVVRADSFWSRLAGAGWAVWFYLYKALVPVHLNFIYPRWLIDATQALSYLPTGLLCAGLVLCWRFRKRWGRGWFFGFGYFVVMLLPVMGFLNIYFMRYSLVADHWQYFAIMGPLALAAVTLTKGLELMGRNASRARASLCGALLLGLGTLTWRQTGMYADIETLWRTVLDKDPNCALALNNLGGLLLHHGREDEALADFQEVVRMRPGDEIARNNLGSALLQQGRVDEAVAQFEKGLATASNSPVLRDNLGASLARKGELDAAVAQYRAAVNAQPDYARAHRDLGEALSQQGRSDEAIAHLQKALELQPDLAEAHYNLGSLLWQRGRVEEAISHLRQAVQLQPANASAHNNLGGILLRQGNLAEARTEFERALSLKPDYAMAHNNLGSVLLREGQVDEAVAHFRKALAGRPDSAEVRENLRQAAWVWATHPRAEFRNGPKALALAEELNRFSGGINVAVLGTLAAATAEAGRFSVALATAQEALRLAASQNNAALANALPAQIERYRAGTPYRDDSLVNSGSKPAQ
jgi:tetratricopeptide (TPR) repeat protein